MSAHIEHGTRVRVKTTADLERCVDASDSPPDLGRAIAAGGPLRPRIGYNKDTRRRQVPWRMRSS